MENQASTNSLSKALLSHPYLLFMANPWGNLSLAICSYLASLSRFKYLSLTIQQREVSVIIRGYLCLWGCSPRTVLLNGWIITILPTLYEFNWTRSVLVTERPCRVTQVTNPTLKRICPATQSTQLSLTARYSSMLLAYSCLKSFWSCCDEEPSQHWNSNYHEKTFPGRLLV